MYTLNIFATSKIHACNCCARLQKPGCLQQMFEHVVCNHCSQFTWNVHGSYKSQRTDSRLPHPPLPNSPLDPSEQKGWTGAEMTGRRLPDGVGTNRVFTEGPQIPYMLSYSFYARTCCHMLSQFATCCYMLLTFSHASSSGGFAALLRRLCWFWTPSGSCQAGMFVNRHGLRRGG